jgi:glycosyltransferase involved in cell wall biosynthesis
MTIPPNAALSLSPRPTVSLVIPAHNEAESIAALAAEIRAVMTESSIAYEIIWIDDGSTDGTAEAIERVLGEHGDGQVVSTRLRSGKSEAYTRGFRKATGRLIATLDADLQDDPAEIPRLMAELDAGYDLVVGRKVGRMGNEPSKAIVSRPFNLALRILFGLDLHDTNSGFRLMRSRVARSLSLYGDLYRFIPQIAHLNGYRVTEVGVRHRKRLYGRSKFGASRCWTGVLDLFTLAFMGIFLKKPLHFFATVGAFSAAMGLALEAYVLVYKVLGSPFQRHIAAITIGVMWIILGVQLFMIGVLAEMLASQRRILQELRPPEAEE